LIIVPAIIDTDVTSYIFNRHPLGDHYRQILEGVDVFVSLTTLAEIEFGMEWKGWGADRRERMRHFLARFSPLYPDRETALIWARIRSDRQKSGRPLGLSDAWIAAAALQFSVPLITHNAEDFRGIPKLEVITAKA
jgi:tRNA(fMet)-specific endonuclease VapC